MLHKGQLCIRADVRGSTSRNTVVANQKTPVMKKKKYLISHVLPVMVMAAMVYSCQKEMQAPELSVAEVGRVRASAKGVLDAPVLTCDASTQSSIYVKVTAGASGLPAGFSVQWMPKSVYESNGAGWGDSLALRKASFSGNANLSRYDLAPGESMMVNIGELLFDQGASTNSDVPLECGTDYVFRAFAHATNVQKRSAFTENLVCKTLPCLTGSNCTYTQGYWKTHGPVPVGNNEYVWPQSVKDNGLKLGTVLYMSDQLLQVFNRPAAGNGLLVLSHQLIAAKLNIANGAQAGQDVLADIVAADALIGGRVVPPVGTGTLTNSSVSALTNRLTSFNEGDLGVPHCK